MWALTTMYIKNNIQKRPNSKDKKQTEPPKKKKDHTVIPYSQELYESIKNIYSKYGIQVHFKSSRTLKNIIVICKDKDNIKQKSRVIYW